MRTVNDLEVFVGVWEMKASLPVEGDPPHVETTFEWLEGRRFLVNAGGPSIRTPRTASLSSASTKTGERSFSTTSTRAASPACSK